MEYGRYQGQPDKKAVLRINITGSSSTETKTHTINVQHRCPPSAAPPAIMNQPAAAVPPNNVLASEGHSKRSSKKSQSKHREQQQQQQDYPQFGSSEVHDLCRMRCP